MRLILLSALLPAALAACHRTDPADDNAARAAAANAAHPAPAGPVLANGQDLAALPVNGAPMAGVPAGIPAYPGATFTRAELMGDRDWRYIMHSSAATPAQVIDYYATAFAARGFILPSRGPGPAGPAYPALSMLRERDGQRVGVGVETEPARDGGGTTILVRVTLR